MKLIIDSNAIMSALIKDSKSREIVLESGFEFYHPEISLRNIIKHEDEIIKKADVSKKQFKEIYNVLLEKILLIKTENFLANLEEAKLIMGHIEIEDVPFIALALSIPNDGIWTDDEHFQKQNRIKIYTTSDIIKEFLSV